MSAAPTMLGLPAGDVDRPSHALSVATLMAGVAELSLVGALVAAYLNVRGLLSPWPPEGVDLDNYLGTMLFITVWLSVITAEWAVFALKRGNRKQALNAIGITIGLGVAFVNLLWYTGTQFHFGPADHTYAVIAYAMLIAVGVIAVVGMAFLLVALARISGGQVTPRNPSVLRAAAWHWHVVVVAWSLAFLALYVLQHR